MCLRVNGLQLLTSTLRSTYLGDLNALTVTTGRIFEHVTSAHFNHSVNLLASNNLNTWVNKRIEQQTESRMLARLSTS